MKKNVSEIENRAIFQRNLKRHLDLTGKTQKEVAIAIGATTGNFSDWLKGRSFPRIEKLQALAEYFGIPVSELIDDVNVGVDSVSDQDQKVLDLFHKIPKEKRAEAIALCESVLKTLAKF
jgi:transcriptional regulator with XRE-family HTH domain